MEEGGLHSAPAHRGSGVVNAAREGAWAAAPGFEVGKRSCYFLVPPLPFSCDVGPLSALGKMARHTHAPNLASPKECHRQHDNKQQTERKILVGEWNGAPGIAVWAARLRVTPRPSERESQGPR